MTELIEEEKRQSGQEVERPGNYFKDILRKADTAINTARNTITKDVFQKVTIAAIVGSCFLLPSSSDVSSNESLSRDLPGFPPITTSSLSISHQPTSPPQDRPGWMLINNDQVVKPPEKPTDPTYITDMGFGLVRVAIDRNGLPTDYRLPNGVDVPLDYNMVKEAHDRAIADKEPEIVALVQITTPQNLVEDGVSAETPSNPVEHPIARELPADTLSDEELAQHGLRIIEPVNGTHLYIRRGALAEGGLLSGFRNGKEKMTIAVVNGSTLSIDEMQDPRYKDVLSSFASAYHHPTVQLAQYKNEKLTEELDTLPGAQQSLKTETLKIRNGQEQASDGSYEDAWRGVLGIKQRIYLLRSNLEDTAILQYLATHGDGEYTGLYIPPHSAGNTDPIVFVADGTANDVQCNIATIYFTPNGEPRIELYPITIGDQFGGPLLTANSNVSHLDMSRIQRNPNASPQNPNSYLYPGLNPEFVLRHELSHHDLITENTRRGLPADYSEYNTDMNAYNSFQLAYQRWEASGFKDDSGYYFIWQLPNKEEYLFD